jgi:chromosome transmission fidelity protein 4
VTFRFLCDKVVDLSVPTSKSVRVFARETWDESADLTPSSELAEGEVFSATCWSPDASHVAAGTTKGTVCVWKLKDRKVVASKKTTRGYGIASIAWNPAKASEVAFIDNQGYWGLLEKLNCATGGSSDAPKATTSQSVHIVEDKDEFNEEELAAALFDDDDDDDENSFSIRKIKAATTGFLDNDDDDSNMEEKRRMKGDESAATSAAPTPTPAVHNHLRTLIKSVKHGSHKMSDVKSSTIKGFPFQAALAPLPPAAVLDVDIQDAFQSGSTPAHLSSRFMVWNGVGMIRCYNTPDDNSIEVHNCIVGQGSELRGAHTPFQPKKEYPPPFTEIILLSRKST